MPPKTILFPFLPHRSAITCPSFLPPTAFAALPVVQPPSAIKPGLFLKKEQCWPGLTHLSCFWRHVKRAVKIYFKKLNKITSTLLSWMIRLHASISYCSKSVKCYLGQIPLDYLFNQLSKRMCLVVSGHSGQDFCRCSCVHLASAVIWMCHERIF